MKNFKIFALVSAVALTVFLGRAYFRKTPSSSPNIIFIVIDTLSSQYILDEKLRAESPNIQRMIDEGTSFTHAYSTAPWTRPAIASLFTGELPYRHQVRNLNSAISSETPTLAEELSKRGYDTAGFVSHMLISEQTSFKRGFDIYKMVQLKENVHEAVTSKQVTQSALGWIEQQKEAKAPSPFFLFLHYFDPHYSYRHHKEFDRSSWYKGGLQSGYTFRKFRKQIDTLSSDDIRYMQNLHQEEISYTDRQIGKLLETVRKDPALHSSVVILTADHGEEFAEHGGAGHGRTLYNEVLQVPLVIWSPQDMTKRVVDEWISTADLMPTVLEMSGDARTLDSKRYSRSLKSFLSSTPRATGNPERILFSEVDFNAYLVGVLRYPHKLVHNKETKLNVLYHLEKDPAEKNDLFNTEPEIARELKTELEWFLFEQQNAERAQASQQDSHNPADKEAIRKLRSLGYVRD